ncbi:hypothetical protein J6590_101475 [Homalodisca vitripennis]|nr:hypothetical protein J6590_101475 [Homalodisca vitripennis]
MVSEKRSLSSRPFSGVKNMTRPQDTRLTITVLYLARPAPLLQKALSISLTQPGDKWLKEDFRTTKDKIAQRSPIQAAVTTLDVA